MIISEWLRKSSPHLIKQGYLRNSMDITLENDLILQANKVRAHCYAPYSQFRVGCAILLTDGSVITGVNIENASYSVTLCAERSAMASVISAAKQNDIKALAIVTKSSPPSSPCGVCRQFLSEFLDAKVVIILANEKGEKISTTIAELLPGAFNKTNL